MSLWDWVKDKTAEAWGEFEAKTGLSPDPVHSYMLEVVEGKLWRCSWPDGPMLTYLQTSGCQYVVNLCAEREESSLVIAHHMEPVYIPEIDGTAVHMQGVQQFFNVCGYGPTAVHCRAGHGRTGQYIAAYRVIKQNWTPTAALYEARSFGKLLPDQVKFILDLKAAQ